MNNFFFLLKKKNFFGAICVLSFRIAHFFSIDKRWLLGFPFILLYKVVFRCIIGFDVHERTSIGRNFCPWHCNGLVISPKSVIGDNVIVHHNTTIGEKNGCGVIVENDVCVAPQCSLVGKIRIGEHSIIGIGSVCVKDVPSYSVVAGNPAKIIKQRVV